MKKKRLTLAVVLVCALLLGIAGTVYATGYTYGQYNMTYLPGTTDTVTNMPENETGLTPGANSPYTVTSTVPQREGFEFIDWTLTWGTMEKPETPVDYSDALAASKKATAAAAGDSNTARAYTITLEAKVNINADDPTGLFVENLTVTDTIENEFALNSVTAEILDSAGSVVSSDAVTAEGPTVTHDFGNVEHGYTARLILEVTAQTDYIGSNGVYTNVGESGWTYKHTDPEATAAEEYSVTCADKPQVNVPIVFSVNPRGKDVEHHMGDVATFDGTNIPIPAHEAAQKYDQINGTFSYSWKLHNETTVPVEETVHVSGGTPDASEEVLNGMSSITWQVPTNIKDTDYEETLYVTFTPDEVTEGEFADATTAEPVNALTKDGALTLTVIPREAEIEILAEYTVRYLEKGTNKVLADPKDGIGVEGKPVTESAIEIDGYTACDPTVWEDELTNGMVITFYYEKEAPALTDYVVKYLDKDTNEPVADEKTESGLEVGTSVTETAIAVNGYRLSETDDQGEPQSEEISLVLAESGNEIIFYYQILPMLTTYTIHYCDAMTGEEIAEPKTVPDVPVGLTVTEYAISIAGYIPLDDWTTFTLMESGYDYYFYYLYNNVD